MCVGLNIFDIDNPTPSFAYAQTNEREAIKNALWEIFAQMHLRRRTKLKSEFLNVFFLIILLANTMAIFIQINAIIRHD